MNACGEGDDIPEPRALKIICFRDNFCSVEDSELQGFSATGPGCLKSLASRLLAAGHPPDMPVILFRGGERTGKTTLANAAFYAGDEV